jgi:hypothetical protein
VVYRREVMRGLRSAAWLGLGLCVAGCPGTDVPGLDEGPVLGSSTGDRPGITTFNSTVDPTLPGEESVEGSAEGTTTSAVDDTTSEPGTGTMGSTSEPGTTASTTDPDPGTSSGSSGSSSSSTTDPTTGGGCNDVPGVYENCVEMDGSIDNTPCMSAGDSTCLYTGAVGNPTAGVCAFTDCVDACDCPAAPASGNAVVSCDDVTGDPAELFCYLDCAGGETCPNGMTCFAGFLCAWPGPAAEGTPYGDCLNLADVCGLDGVCLNNGAMPTIGVCTEECNVNGDCPPSPGGTAPVSCEDVTGDMVEECILDCSGGQNCPAGMTCFQNLLCAWD